MYRRRSMKKQVFRSSGGKTSEWGKGMEEEEVKLGQGEGGFIVIFLFLFFFGFFFFFDSLIFYLLNRLKKNNENKV